MAGPTRGTRPAAQSPRRTPAPGRRSEEVWKLGLHSALLRGTGMHGSCRGTRGHVGHGVIPQGRASPSGGPCARNAASAALVGWGDGRHQHPVPCYRASDLGGSHAKALMFVHENCTRLKINKATRQSYHKEKDVLAPTPGEVWLPPLSQGAGRRPTGAWGFGAAARILGFTQAARWTGGPPSEAESRGTSGMSSGAVPQAHLPPLTGAVVVGEAAPLMAVVGRPPLPGRRHLPPLPWG